MPIIAPQHPDQPPDPAFTSAEIELRTALRRKNELIATIDAQIAAAEDALQRKRERRAVDLPHEGEKRSGFDRRARTDRARG